MKDVTSGYYIRFSLLRFRIWVPTKKHGFNVLLHFRAESASCFGRLEFTTPCIRGKVTVEAYRKQDAFFTTLKIDCLFILRDVYDIFSMLHHSKGSVYVGCLFAIRPFFLFSFLRRRCVYYPSALLTY
ncbi:hypothetical protein TNCT_529831 [Trichonephila clavata]|uniref:Uncharacterized protein n=1 Tax=Trichonephila clavata TaxID=2740835 RepID=A0A8X6HSU5_TRICU|nr:hypothetical protein TNCT_529831 [Trichonephila clavata]